MLSVAIARRFQLIRRINNARGIRNLLANQDGLRCDHGEVAIDIVTDDGDTTRHRFFYDSGADLMVIPTHVAHVEGIRYSAAYPGMIASSLGGDARCFYDYVQVRSSLSGKVHRWVCAFAESERTRLVVGRAGFLHDFAACFRGNQLIVSHSVSVRRFLQHQVTRLCARSRDAWEPI